MENFKDKKGDDILEKLVHINRITKVVKGGRRFGFSALVVVGNQAGKIGIAHAKAKQVPDAIKKANEMARRKLTHIPLREGRTITSTADKEVTVILADAQKQSEIMKGEGDGLRNKIFADAFGQDPEFFAFYRAMQAYEKALIGGETSLILSPDSEFFKFFGNIKPEIQQ